MRPIILQYFVVFRMSSASSDGDFCIVWEIWCLQIY